MNTTILITGLLLLIAANVFMMYIKPFGLKGVEGFQQDMDASGNKMEMFQDASGNEMMMEDEKEDVEGFSSYSLTEAAGANKKYEPIGAFDGVKLSTGNNISTWRYTAPNEPLRGPAFEPGPDSLFIFKNNQCKPECCGASFSCGGGCVCTTPQQRDYINQRGGNRTLPDDAV